VAARAAGKKQTLQRRASIEKKVFHNCKTTTKFIPYSMEDQNGGSMQDNVVH
jgi:hypothetical protein